MSAGTERISRRGSGVVAEAAPAGAAAGEVGDGRPPPGPALRGGEWAGVHVLLSPAAARLDRVLLESPDLAVSPHRPRTTAPAAPVIDDDGLLRYGDRWVAIPDAQLPLATLLVGRFQSTVSDAELAAAYETHADSRVLFGAVNRLSRRVARCDLALRRVRLRGYILDRAELVI